MAHARTRLTLLALTAASAACAFSAGAPAAADAKGKMPSTAPTFSKQVPESRGGQDLVGTKWPALAFDRWIAADGKPVGADGKPVEHDGSVSLYRWWTNTCPFCASSLPALEDLRTRYGPAGLRVVAVYHPKPPREVTDEAVREAAKEIGFNGPLAVDTDWSELKRLYLSTGRRGATSASFLVDRAGVIRFVHPGPDLFPSAEPQHARQDEDFKTMEQAVRALLDEPAATPTTRPTPAAPPAKSAAPPGRF